MIKLSSGLQAQLDTVSDYHLAEGFEVAMGTKGGSRRMVFLASDGSGIWVGPSDECGVIGECPAESGSDLVPEKLISFIVQYCLMMGSNQVADVFLERETVVVGRTPIGEA